MSFDTLYQIDIRATIKHQEIHCLQGTASSIRSCRRGLPTHYPPIARTTSYHRRQARAQIHTTMSAYWPYTDPYGQPGPADPYGSMPGIAMSQGNGPWGSQPYGGSTAYRPFNNLSVPRGVFPDQRWSNAYQIYKPCGMLDPTTRDRQGNWRYCSAPFDYGVYRNGKVHEIESRFERDARQYANSGRPSARGGEFGVLDLLGQYSRLPARQYLPRG